MSWNKIEDYLFERYCVEGEDKTLSDLMEEHDREIRNNAIDVFATQIKENFGSKSKQFIGKHPIWLVDSLADYLKSKGSNAE